MSNTSVETKVRARADGPALPIALTQHITAFRDRPNSPRAAFNRCRALAVRFARLTGGRVVRLVGSPAFSRPFGPWRAIPPQFRIHYVAAVEDEGCLFVVDWAARQFDPAAPVPLIFRELEATGWTAWNDVTPLGDDGRA